MKIPKPARRQLPNRTSSFSEVTEEQAARQGDAERMARMCRHILPGLKGDMERISDPRQKGKIKHPISSVLMYGVLAFMLCAGSRREINRSLSTPVAAANIEAMVGFGCGAPHGDTLARVLKAIDPEDVQNCYAKLIKRLLGLKEFKAAATCGGRFVVAVDGSMKYSRAHRFSKRAIHRRVGADGGEVYGAYVLEAVLVFADGPPLPLLTEFVENRALDSESDKQDCETRAFRRMAPKLAKLLGRDVTILLDGLYATGPTISLCKARGWKYAITLKPGSMPSVWEEAEGLTKADPSSELTVEYGAREQTLKWANGIEYTYGNNHKRLSLNVAVLDEKWEESRPRSGGAAETRRSRYAWILSRDISHDNAFTLCNLIARKRWAIENEFKSEKHDGAMFEHCFSLDWNTAKGFHYLMKIGRAIVLLAAHCELFSGLVEDLGVKGFVSYLRLVMTGSILDVEAIRRAAASPFRLRMNLGMRLPAT
jgi:hypothetical protein